MAGLDALGAAAVDEATLAGMLAAHLRLEGPVEVVEVEVEEFPYDLVSITTLSRHRVHGRVATPAGEHPFRLFVKVVQAWERSPLFAFVPEHLREVAAKGVPWRTEPLAYRSDLASRLPDGLTMPTALAVMDVDDLTCAIWLEELDVVDVPWDDARSTRAARLLGRLSGSRRVRPLAGVSGLDWTLRDYLTGRFDNQVHPMLRDDDIWEHPLVAASFDAELRDRLRDAADGARETVEEALSLPHLPAHGDACPNNLLAVDGVDGFVLIDYSYWMSMPPGADLGQLLVGDVQIGRTRAGDLAGRDAAHRDAYVAGLRDEGCDVPAEAVARGHALHHLLLTGLSSVPWEHLGAPPTPELAVMAQDRAAIARFCLDRVDATAGAGVAG
ncbi:phosphotransferase [Phycicoccus avicenniae]|uniref:phosphotransferase n=1 Tax=Phycicoccus avicenniae TaxID=2828860 RepID=UPI003D2E0ECD